MSLCFEIKGYPGLNFIFHKAESQSLVNIFFSKQSFLISFKVLGQNRHACGKLFSLRLRLFFCLSPVRLVNGPMETNTVRLLYWRLCECQKCLPFYFHYGFIFIGLVHGRSSVLYFVCFTLFLFFVFFLSWICTFLLYDYYSEDYLSSKVLFRSGDAITIGCLVVWNVVNMK